MLIVAPTLWVDREQWRQEKQPLHIISIGSVAPELGGGALQVRGEIKTHCKGAVALYGIPGDYTPTEIIKHVAWLTGKKGIFKYGGIDLAARNFFCCATVLSSYFTGSHVWWRL
ncbi:hypothetical protein B0H10DRAFT_1962844 [Mycena sp. CBHHK59/15]|nr:hypothetical protein B0H10DRAFT_1962844 [Mycena sp. CBHHK59/15]